MYQVLARKWRPKTFKDVIGQDHISGALANAVKLNKVAHAYLLTGTRGVGKTSIARIFAKAIRCENLDTDANPCLKCSACIEIDNSNAINYIEIDGASNNGVDNIREIVENVQYLPTFGSKKVYVIDEVHMLSTGAFNALLKTLEEPPEHVTFIFATTDPHKLLGTVLSRCQRFDFRHVNVEKLVEHLENIINSEDIKIESTLVLETIAREAKGSVRDALSLLDQALSLSLNEQISLEQLSMSLGLASQDKVQTLISLMIESKSDDLKSKFTQIINENIDLKKLLNQILDEVDKVVENIDNPALVKERLGIDISEISLSEILWIYESLIKDFEWAISSFDPNRVSTLALLKISKRYEIFNKEKKKTIIKERPQEIPQAQETQVIEEVHEVKIETPQIQVKEEVKTDEMTVQESKSWKGFISHLYKEIPSIAMNLERAQTLFDKSNIGKTLDLAFLDTEKIFYDIINEPETKEVLKKNFAGYFDYKVEDITIKIEMINRGVKEEKKLQSTVEIEEKNIQDKFEESENNIKTNKYILEAQELFSVNVDKISVNKKS